MGTNSHTHSSLKQWLIQKDELNSHCLRRIPCESGVTPVQGSWTAVGSCGHIGPELGSRLYSQQSMTGRRSLGPIQSLYYLLRIGWSYRTYMTESGKVGPFSLLCHISPVWTNGSLTRTLSTPRSPRDSFAGEPVTRSVGAGAWPRDRLGPTPRRTR